MKKINSYVLLHVLFMIYSFSGILSKVAAHSAFLSLKFCLCYSGILLLLGLYAIFWQQIIKKLSLTSAYANKAIAVVWGMLWGLIFFGEIITLKKIIGALIIILGIVIYSISDNKKENKKHE